METVHFMFPVVYLLIKGSAIRSNVLRSNALLKKYPAFQKGQTSKQTR